VTNPLPVLQGAPDFLPQLASSNIQVIRKSESIAALTTYPIVYVGNIPYMYVRISAAVAMNLGIAWFADSAGSQSLFGDVVTTNATAADAIVCIPVRGPYVKFTVERGVYPGTINLDAFAVFSRFNVYAGTDGENILVSADGTSIAANSTASFLATTVRAGRISWTCEVENSASFLARLYCTDFTGTIHLLDAMREGARGMSRQTYAPALPLHVFVNNQVAAAHNAFVTVVHHPFDF